MVDDNSHHESRVCDKLWRLTVPRASTDLAPLLPRLARLSLLADNIATHEAKVIRAFKSQFLLSPLFRDTHVVCSIFASHEAGILASDVCQDEDHDLVCTMV